MRTRQASPSAVRIRSVKTAWRTAVRGAEDTGAGVTGKGGNDGRLRTTMEMRVIMFGL